jgi:hypothetical protein
MRGNDGCAFSPALWPELSRLAGVDLRLYASNNSELSNASTDGKMYVRFDPGLLRGGSAREPALLIVYCGAIITFSI